MKIRFSNSPWCLHRRRTAMFEHGTASSDIVTVKPCLSFLNKTLKRHMELINDVGIRTSSIVRLTKWAIASSEKLLSLGISPPKVSPLSGFIRSLSPTVSTSACLPVRTFLGSLWAMGKVRSAFNGAAVYGWTIDKVGCNLP